MIRVCFFFITKNDPVFTDAFNHDRHQNHGIIQKCHHTPN